MNQTREPGPCAGYEHLIVELLEGSLGPEESHAVRSHLAGCPRCRAWKSELDALDVRLAGALPRPALSKDFAANLRELIAAEARTATRRDLRETADDEYRHMVDVLRRGSRRNAVLGALAAGIATSCGLVVVRSLLPEASALLPALSGEEREIALGALGAAIALAALAWSGAREVLPVFRLRS